MDTPFGAATGHVPGGALSLPEAATLLRGGGVVAVPTETVYGLAASIRRPAALRRVFAVKGRPLLDPLIVHVPDLRAAESVAVFHDLAREVALRFWPGALTLVLPRREGVDDLVTASRPSVAVRVPGHPLMHALLEAVGEPLAAPSANPFGYLSPTRAAHVAAMLGERIDGILDGGPCRIGVESTILDLRDPANPALLRPGGVPVEALEAFLGRRVPDGRAARQEARGGEAGMLAPGMLERHYQPRRRLALFPAGGRPETRDGDAVVFLRRPDRPRAGDCWLSEDGDLDVAAASLFDLLHALDGSGTGAIHVETPPRGGLGEALLDRLTRAAAPRA